MVLAYIRIVSISGALAIDRLRDLTEVFQHLCDVFSPDLAIIVSVEHLETLAHFPQACRVELRYWIA